jgi:UDP:flavonoid glycosyltransferase YjiC (YdhE family)
MGRPTKRIVLATIGSLGDLHPMLALAIGLRERGHEPVIASTELYRAKVEGLGLEFHAIRPDIAAHDPELMAGVMDMRRGPEVLLRELILPALPDTYEDLSAAADGADLLVAGEIVFAAPLVAEKMHLPWVSALLSPFSFYSAYDPPVSPYAPSLGFLGGLGWRFNKILIALGRFAFRSWWEPVYRLRREKGLRSGGDPLFEAKFSANLILALFSPEIARPQPDWPARTVQPGYLFYDQDETRSGLPPELETFLQAGEAPLVFTLGSSAVHDPRGFFEASAEAARILNRRAVFLCGQSPPPATVPGKTIAVPYAPFSELFPRAAVVVHQGGSGTTAQVLRAGRPALVMPCAFDQPDNAARVKRIGAGFTISRNSFKALTAARRLDRLLSDPSYASKAAIIAETLRNEDGLSRTCAAIERLLGSQPTAASSGVAGKVRYS